MFTAINRNLLKSIMLADGIFSLAAAALLFILPGPIGALVGPLATPVALNAFAAFFVLWGAFHLIVSRQEQPSAAAVHFAIAGDAAWIIGSIAVLIFAGNGLTLTGMGFIALAAVIVADVLLLKQVGLGRQRRAALA